jgi:hypothetical protein
MSLTLSDKEVTEFYTNYKLDYEEINRSIVRMLKGVIDTAGSINHNVISSMTDKLSCITQKLDTIDNSFKMTTNDISTSIMVQLSEYRKTYMEDMKLILSSNNTENVLPILKDISSSLIDKTTLLFSDILPKHQTILSQEITQNIQSFKTNFQSEIEKLSYTQMDKKTMEEYVTTIQTIIKNNEAAMEEKLREIKDATTSNQTSQNSLNINILEILKKFENASSKGRISENILTKTLIKLYPHASIDHIGNEQKETGDILFKNEDSPKILIENKDHTSKNVPKLEVDKFIRDCEIQDCCGIMLAQHSGICNKRHFELQLNGNNVLLYVHEVNFEPDTIRLAIKIVEQFKTRLEEMGDMSEYNIGKELLENINKEYIIISNKRLSLIRIIKDFTDKIMVEINDIKMPCLDNYIKDKFASSMNQNKEENCPFCGIKVKKCLSKHYRHCSVKKKEVKVEQMEEESGSD